MEFLHDDDDPRGDQQGLDDQIDIVRRRCDRKHMRMGFDIEHLLAEVGDAIKHELIRNDVNGHPLDKVLGHFVFVDAEF